MLALAKLKNVFFTQNKDCGVGPPFQYSHATKESQHEINLSFNLFLVIFGQLPGDKVVNFDKDCLNAPFWFFKV